MADDRLHLSLVIETEGGPESRRQIEEISRALDRIARSNLSFSALRELSREIEAGRRRMDDLDAETRQAVEAFRRLERASSSGLREISSQSRRAQANVGELAGTVSRLKAALAAAAAGQGLGAVVKQAIDLESAMAEVAKTTGLAGKELQGLQHELQGMAEQTGIATTELAKIAAIGGQLGVPREQLAQFVKLASEMAVAFDMGADQAAEAIGHLQAATGASLQEIRALGDAINALGNNMAARERDIVNVVERIAGVAKTAGLAREEAAALAAAFLALGKPPEVAGTAINALINKLQTAKAQGKQFQEGLSAIGLSASELSRRMREDAAGAIVEVLARLQKLDAEARAITLTKLFGAEWQDDIAAVVSNLGVLRKALTLVRQETEGAMAEEFQRRLQTTEVQLNRAKAAVENLAAAIGGQLLDEISSAAGTFADLTRAVSDFVAKNPQIVEAAKAIGQVVVAAAGVKGLTTAVQGLGVALNALRAHPILAIVTALQAAAAYAEPILRTKVALDRFGGSIEKLAVGEMVSALQQGEIKLKDFNAALQAGTLSASQLRAGFAALNGESKAFDEALSALVQELAEAKPSAEEVSSILGILAQKLKDGSISGDQLQAAVSQLGAALQDVSPKSSALASILDALRQKFQDGSISAGELAQTATTVATSFNNTKPPTEALTAILGTLEQAFRNGKISGEELSNAVATLHGTFGNLIPQSDSLKNALQVLNSEVERSKEAAAGASQGFQEFLQVLLEGAGVPRELASGVTTLSEAVAALNKSHSDGTTSAAQLEQALVVLNEAFKQEAAASGEAKNAAVEAANAHLEVARATKSAVDAQVALAQAKLKEAQASGDQNAILRATVELRQAEISAAREAVEVAKAELEASRAKLQAKRDELSAIEREIAAKTKVIRKGNELIAVSEGVSEETKKHQRELLNEVRALEQDVRGKEAAYKKAIALANAKELEAKKVTEATGATMLDAGAKGKLAEKTREATQASREFAAAQSDTVRSVGLSWGQITGLGEAANKYAAVAKKAYDETYRLHRLFQSATEWWTLHTWVKNVAEALNYAADAARNAVIRAQELDKQIAELQANSSDQLEQLKIKWIELSQGEEAAHKAAQEYELQRIENQIKLNELLKERAALEGNMTEVERLTKENEHLQEQLDLTKQIMAVERLKNGLSLEGLNLTREQVKAALAAYRAEQQRAEEAAKAKETKAEEAEVSRQVVQEIEKAREAKTEEAKVSRQVAQETEQQARAQERAADETERTEYGARILVRNLQDAADEARNYAIEIARARLDVERQADSLLDLKARIAEARGEEEKTRKLRRRAQLEEIDLSIRQKQLELEEARRKGDKAAIERLEGEIRVLREKKRLLEELFKAEDERREREEQRRRREEGRRRREETPRRGPSPTDH